MRDDQPTGEPGATPLFRDPSQALAERVRDLIGRLTLDEKVSQLSHTAAAIPRLDIPAYNWWNEALHGVARNGRATVFPQAIGMGATWNPALAERVASAIADEGRAKYHAALRRAGSTDWYQGLTFWTPNVNIFRDPRWGRGQETYGEDPHLTGEMGAAFVRGLQGDHPRYLKSAACAKHYAVHSGPERDRHSFDARVSPRDLRTTYLPAFKKLVTEAHVEAVMGAYNRTNGEPCCASPTLIDQILRGEWGFRGHFVSDCWAINDFHSGHKITADPIESAALALRSGCDLCCGETYDFLDEAIRREMISEADLDLALERLLPTRFKLGMFDPAELVPYAATPMSVVGCEAHRELAREAARSAVVLLKNDGILPIRPETGTLLIVGPTATEATILLGNYFGMSDSLCTLLEGVAGRAPEGMRVEYLPGCLVNHPNTNPNNWSVFSSRNADIVVACVGLVPMLEGEEGEAIESADHGDRADIALPAAQMEYLKELAVRGVKLVLVVSGGSPVALGELAELATAILFIWYPGQEGGRAVAEILFGDAVPSGKLPITFPRSVADLPPFGDYAMAGRTYRYAEAEPLYPFGFGLSYTTFSYESLTLSQAQLPSGAGLRAQVTLVNSGATHGEEVVQLYLSDTQASVPVPRATLVGFRRVGLAPGERAELSFEITADQMALYDDDGRARIEPGEFRLTAGGCSPGARGLALGAPAPVSATFTVV
jgi:beta-glucosidase